jgi:small subunit ribosomal protein S7
MAEVKFLNKWSFEGVEVKDAGLVNYINLKPMIIPRTGGRHARRQFYKSKLNIIERLINKLFVPGHKGKRHKTTSGHNVGKTINVMNVVDEAFEIIAKKTGKNPVEVLVRAVENTAPLEEVITYQRGGIFVREPVVTSPQRRVDLALRHIAQGTYQKSFNNRKSAAEALAEEILGAYNKDVNASYAYSERIRREKEAVSSR